MTNNFDDKFGALLAEEMILCRNNPEQTGELIERLARALGFTIAMATKGNPNGIDMFVEGVTGYIHEEAVAKSRIAQLIG